jgi:hypothetical protein
MAAWESEDLSPDQREAFWRRVVESETAPQTSHLRQLAEAGVDLPAPETMDDGSLTKKLWELIHALAALRVFLDSTDHLSDRELYALLRNDVLPDEIPADLPQGDDGYCVLDLLGGSDSDVYLKYYAGEKERQWWKEDFPDYDLPAQEDPPFDRDRLLPLPATPAATTH